MIGKIKKLLQKTFLYRIYLLLVKKIRFFTIDFCYPRIYKKAAKAKVDPNKIIFIEFTHAKLTNSFIPMYEKLKEMPNTEIHCHFILQTTVNQKQQRKRCIKLIKDIGDAKCIFLNEPTDIFSKIKIRDETTVVQLWHGCGAFKKFGFSTGNLIFGASSSYMKSHSFHSNYDLITVSSEEVMWAYEEAMGYSRESGVVRPTGISRTDVFFDKDYINNAVNSVHSVIDQAKDKKIILYAPTFRGQADKAYAPDILDFEEMKNALGKNYVCLIKHHPLVKNRPQIPQSCSDFAFDVTDTLSIEELICSADICISDYSSLIFEFSLFERPMMFLAYDLEDYFDWRGFYYDYYEFSPGPIVKNTKQVIDYISNIDERFDKKKVTDFKNKFMSCCDGKATQRIIDIALK